jgi:outer membrane protein TolC
VRAEAFLCVPGFDIDLVRVRMRASMIGCGEQASRVHVSRLAIIKSRTLLATATDSAWLSIRARYRGTLRHAVRWTAWCLVLGACASPARAQSSSSAAEPATREAIEGPAPFRAPSVSDPLLAPVASPPRVLRSWSEAIAELRQHAPTYLSSYQGVLRAQAQVRTARAAVLPTLNGQGSYTHQFLVGTATVGGVNVETPPQDVFGVNAQLVVPVINPRGLYGIGTASRNVELAQRSLEESKRELAKQVVDAMLSSLASQRVAGLNRQGLSAALERLSLAQARLRFGQSPQLDVDRAEQDVGSARAAVIQGDEAVFQSREQLGNLLGSSTPVGAAEELDLAAFEQAIVKTCRVNPDIDAQPQVAASRARVVLAERAIGDARLRVAPTLSLASQAGYQTQVQLGPRALWNVQGLLSIPFYDGGARYGAEREARALLAQAREELVAARLRALTAVARAQRAVKVAEASREVAAQQAELAQRVDARIREGYARGVGTSLDLVISAQSLRQVQTNLAVLEFEVGKARAGAVLANAECVY